MVRPVPATTQFNHVTLNASFALAAALLLAGGCGACAEMPDPFAAVLNDTVSYGSLGQAAEQMAETGPCLEPCRAMRDLADAYDTLLHRTFSNRMVLLPPVPSEATLARRHERALRRAILSHPERVSLYCTILAKVADHVGGDDRMLMTRWTVEISARLDSPRQDCLGPVLAALPRTPEEMETLEGLRSECRVDHWAWCARLVRRSR